MAKSVCAVLFKKTKSFYPVPLSKKSRYLNMSSLEPV